MATFIHNGFVIDPDAIPSNLQRPGKLEIFLAQLDEAVAYLESSPTGAALVQNQRALGIPIVFDNNSYVPNEFQGATHWNPDLYYFVTDADGAAARVGRTRLQSAA